MLAIVGEGTEVKILAFIAMSIDRMGVGSRIAGIKVVVASSH